MDVFSSTQRASRQPCGKPIFSLAAEEMFSFQAVSRLGQKSGRKFGWVCILSAALLGLAGQQALAQTSSYAVPSGVQAVRVTLAGAGGGGGGYDTNSLGGNGGAGATVTAVIAVRSGDAIGYVEGKGGAGGKDGGYLTEPPTPGGAGDGSGGAGGTVGSSQGSSGLGGGGGGASSVTVNGTVIRAGGGGGGGGGSNPNASGVNVSGGHGGAAPLLLTPTPACQYPESGWAGASVPNNGISDGGGGGGGGGSYAGGAGVGGDYGQDGDFSATGGEGGASCHDEASVNPILYTSIDTGAAGGLGGSGMYYPALYTSSAPGADGSVSIEPLDISVCTASPNWVNAGMNVTITCKGGTPDDTLTILGSSCINTVIPANGTLICTGTGGSLGNNPQVATTIDPSGMNILFINTVTLTVKTVPPAVPVCTAHPDTVNAANANAEVVITCAVEDETSTFIYGASCATTGTSATCTGTGASLGNNPTVLSIDAVSNVSENTVLLTVKTAPPAVPVCTAHPDTVNAANAEVVITCAVEDGATTFIYGANCTTTGRSATCTGTGASLGNNPTVTSTDAVGNTSQSTVTLTVMLAGNNNAQSVPASSGWGLIALTLMLLGLGAVMLRGGRCAMLRF